MRLPVGLGERRNWPWLSLLAASLAACSSGSPGGGSGGHGGAVGGGGDAGVGGQTGAIGGGGDAGVGGQMGAIGGGGGAAGGAGGMGGAGLQGCDGLGLRQSGALDLNLRAVSITGAITLGGSPLSDETSSRGQLVFTSADGFSTVSVDLGATGPKSYALRVPPATYAVAYRPNAALCAATTPPSVPCGGGLLRSGVAITTDGALDLDIPVVDVTGKVTLTGAPLPDQTVDRGSISFTGGSGPPATAGLGMAGPASYQLKLLPGTYDVTFNGNAAACQTTTAPALPCNSGPIKTAVVVTSSGALDLNVPVVHVTGAVTLAGTTLPSEAADRGALSFTGPTGPGAGSVSSQSFATSGPASYVMSLLPGSYGVSFVANAALCTPATLPKVPCVGGAVVTDAHLSTDGVLDVDLQAVTVVGAVTVKGAAMPAATADRGRLLFANAAGASGSPPSFGTSGPATYQLRALAGTYDVSYLANPALCGTAAMTSPLPCNGGLLKSGVALAVDGALDLDIPVVAVSGAVTLNGAEIPAATQARGALTFTPPKGTTAAATLSFGSTGPVTYALSLWPGSYDVGLAANAQLCASGAAPTAVPCVGGRLLQAVAISSDGALDVDLPAISVTGTVDLDGAPLPTASADRGGITFTRVSTEGGGAVSLPLGESAPSSYALTLIPGDYVVSHAANAGLCDGASAPVVPCASQVLVGCN